MREPAINRGEVLIQAGENAGLAILTLGAGIQIREATGKQPLEIVAALQGIAPDDIAAISALEPLDMAHVVHACLKAGADRYPDACGGLHGMSVEQVGDELMAAGGMLALIEAAGTCIAAMFAPDARGGAAGNGDGA